jgi:CheY-like chemotaxis protein
VICELFLPKMNGLEVIKAIRHIHPRMPIITASGFMFGGACQQMPNFDAMAAEVGATSTLISRFGRRTFCRRFKLRNAVKTRPTL